MVIFSLLVLFFLYFPYITPVSFGTDIQPWGVLLATVFSTILFLSGYKFKKIFISLLIPIIFSLLLFPFQDNQFSSIRSIAGYFTIGLTPLVFHYTLKNHYKITVKFLKLSVILYLVVGLVQTFFDANFMTFLLNRSAAGGGRGVVSLSSEPTFYGLICLFLILTLSALETSNKLIYIALLLFQIVFIAQSSMIVLFLFIFVLFYLLFKLEVKFLLMTFAVGFLIISLISFVNIESRIVHLLIRVIWHPEGLLSDGSINSRLGAIYFSVKGFIDSYGIANGFSAFSDYWESEISKQDVFFQSAKTPPVRIMSFYGGILFELGLAGLLIPVSYSIIIFKAYKNNIRNFFIFFFFVNAILFTGIPMAFSLVGMYFGALIFKAENRTNFYNRTVNKMTFK